MKKFLMIIAMVLTANFANANALHAAEDVLRDEILNQNADVIEADKLEITINKGRSELESSDSEDVSLNSLDVDAKQNRFTAYISVGILPLEITGRYNEMVSVPALKHKMTSRDVIAEEDIVYVDIDSRKLKRGYAIDESDLIGKSPARTISANSPIPSRHVKERNLVEERKSVTIYFQNGVIQMQDVGVAMEDGAKGDFIRVRNSASNVIISGKVVGEGLVEVTPRGQILASR